MRLQSDADVTHRPGRSPRQRGAGHHPGDKLTIGPKGADGKREYRAQGSIMRFFETPIQPVAAGQWEYRYVLRLAKK